MLHKVAEPSQKAAPTSFDGLDATISEAAGWLKGRQASDGHWAFELEADVTIPAEYILLNHYLGEIDDALEAKLATYIRGIQADHGGWPLFYGGELNVSASVKAYYALKLVGDDPNAPHMVRAREAILAAGGASKSNVFTRISLAMFGQLPWRAVPVTRVELMLAPKWFPVHISKVSYWTRTVTVPLLVLTTLQVRARNPRDVGVQELFVTPPEKERDYFTNPTGHWLGEIMMVLDRIAYGLQPLLPSSMRRRAIDKAVEFMTERLNGEDGLGGIFPAIANSIMVMDALNYRKDDKRYVAARKSLEGLLVRHNGSAYCQPCVSPVWDTGLAIHALTESREDVDAALSNARHWLRGRQVLDVVGDWRESSRDVRPGGWAFQYRNDHYPDVDDTAVVVMALVAGDRANNMAAVERAAEWVLGMQSANGGWGAFDVDNDHYILNHMPFADHGALLDPPTSDVTARCISMLAELGRDMSHPAVAKGVEFLKNEQEPDGSWFGRWGTNYVYGTWSVLCALNAVGEDMNAPYIRRAVGWLKSMQRRDGGWGEGCETYYSDRRGYAKASTPSQTAWALLALMAAGEVECGEVAKGVAFLLKSPRDGGKWREDYFNAVGFPRVFYLLYHGYSAYFPLWALARYRNLTRGNIKRPSSGM